jgi:hypothetical protein
VQQFEPLWPQRIGEQSHTCDIARGPVEAGDEAKLDRVVTAIEDDWNCRGCCLGSERRPEAPCRSDDVDLTPNQIGSKRRQSIVLTLGPAVFDRHILTFDVPGFVEALMEWCHRIGGLAWRPAAEKPDHGHRRLLCTRRERPSGRGTA